MHDCGSEKGLMSLQGALDHYAQLLPLGSVTLPLLQAAGLVLAAAVKSGCDLPLFTQSAMDGYALRGADQQGELRLVGEVPAGEVFGRELGAGETVRIFTGAALPVGADTVARQEIVTLDGECLCLEERLKPGQDVRQQGEEVSAGQSLLSAGLVLTPGRIAAAAIAGVSEVCVHARVRVATLITGKEVVRQHTSMHQAGALAAGAVHDANGPLLQSWLQTQTVEALPPLWLDDDLEALTQALRDAATHADLIITTGGASVGRYDYLASAAAQAGFHCDFHGVAQRPGKPLWFGRQGRCLLLALPGNPAAVLAGLYVHAAAILRRLQGAAVMDGWQLGRLASPLCANPKVALLQRMQLEHDELGGRWLAPLPHQASHMLSNLASAQALVWLPAAAGELAAGETLPFLSLL